MNNISYNTKVENEGFNKEFIYKINGSGMLTALVHKDDSYKMNWLNGKEIWGRVDGPDTLTVSIERMFTSEGKLRESYTFLNETEFDIFTRKNEVGIYTTFPDNYESSDICMKERCHAHIWCGKNTAYIYCLRMGGEPPHLGLLLNQGSIDGYSVLRDLERSSNDRGCIILHPEKFHLMPGEKMTLSWDLGWFCSKEEFIENLMSYPKSVLVYTGKPVSFEDEEQGINIYYHLESNEILQSNRELPDTQKIKDYRGVKGDGGIKVLINGTEAAVVRKDEHQIYATDKENKTGYIYCKILDYYGSYSNVLKETAM
ncbi:hypothetical protein [Robinsoniella sp. KNHs210]|uniref:hypothetical protein n=1 Tax=Robinsoniella sp. KNHs210 TaxID=1469950 RepID=UPI0004864FCF|nr:hypothetical protein [Robinsoniella sp. KNHs210]